MSLGAFVRGAFTGYEFGENAKDRKTERTRNEERFEWEQENQARQRENWTYADELRARQRKEWGRTDKQREEQEADEDEIDRLRDDGFEEWQRSQQGSDAAPVPANTPQGTVVAPQASPGSAPSAATAGGPIFPGVSVPEINQPNPGAPPIYYGSDVPRAADQAIRLPLTADVAGAGSGGSGGSGGSAGGMVLTDIQPVKGTYSEEERRQIEREARSNGMTPEQYINSVTGQRPTPNPDRTDDARATRGTGRTGDASGPRTAPQRQAKPSPPIPTRTALTPDANSRAAVDYPYNPSSPEMRAGVMQPGGERTAPRPPANTPMQPPRQNAMGPEQRAPQFAPLTPPAAPRNPDRMVSPDTVAAEVANLTTRDDGAITYGGGAQPRPSTPGLPVDMRVPAGPEAGQPQRQDARTMRTAEAAYANDEPGRAAPDGNPTGQFDVDNVEGVRRGVQTGSTAPRPANPDTTDDARAARGTGRTSDPAPQPEPVARDVDPERSAFVQDIQGLMRKGDISAAQKRIVQGLATGDYGPAGSAAGRALGAIGDYFTSTPEEGQKNAAARRQTADAIDWFNSAEARTLFEGNPDLLTAAASDPIAFWQSQQGAAPKTAEGAPQDAAPAGAAQASPAPASQPAPGSDPVRTSLGQPVYGGMTASQAAQFQDLPPLTMAIEDGASALATNPDADSTAPKEPIEQTRQAAGTFLDYYKSEIAPREVEALVRQGKIAEAERLDTWLKDERTQYLQENYAFAVRAASIGDERGFFNYIGKVYNSYDNGYRFVAEESDLFKNEDGQTVAKITVESTTTGERFTQEYEGGEDLIKQALTIMDPVSIFKELEGQATAEAAAQTEQQAWEIEQSRERISGGRETVSDRRRAYDDAVKVLSENDMNWSRLSPEERAIAVQQYLTQREQYATGTGGAPVYLGD